MGMFPIYQLIALGTLLLVGAFFSAIEAALIGTNRARLKMLMQERKSHEKAIRVWLEDPNRLLTTIMVGVNIVAISASALATSVAIGCSELYGLNRSLTVFISTITVILIILVFGEIIPKIISIHNSEKVTLLLINPLYIFDRFFSVVTKIFVGISNLTIKVFKGTPMKRVPLATADEIHAIVDAGREEGVITEQERKMIRNIFGIGDIPVESIMVPRVDMVCVKADATVDEIIRIFLEKGRSKIPIYEDSVDNIIGTINIRDLLRFWRQKDQDLRAVEFMRLPYFIPETKKVAELLREFQEMKISIAIVSDEYGGVSGLVTMQDLINEIMGELQDEFDRGEAEYKQLEDGSYIVNSIMNLEEINELFGTTLDVEDIHTIGGLVFHHLGKIPEKGAKFQLDELEIEVVETSGRRINKLHIKKIQSTV